MLLDVDQLPSHSARLVVSSPWAEIFIVLVELTLGEVDVDVRRDNHLLVVVNLFTKIKKK